MMLPKKLGSGILSISAFALLPLAGISAANAQTAQIAPRGDFRGAYSMLVGDQSYLGVQTENVSKENFGKYNLNEPRGVAVVKVSENSPAAQAGLRDGDVIVRFEGEDVKSVVKLQRLISEVAPDQKIRITILRGGSEQELIATMGKRPQPQFRSFGNLPEGAFNLPPLTGIPRGERFPPEEFGFEIPNGADVFGFSRSASRRLGVSVSPLGKQLGDYFGVADGKGLLIENVVENSPAAKAGLKAGDVIVEIEGEPTANQSDLIRGLNRKAEGEIALSIVRNRQRQIVRLVPESAKPAATKPETKFKA